MIFEFKYSNFSELSEFIKVAIRYDADTIRNPLYDYQIDTQDGPMLLADYIIQPYINKGDIYRMKDEWEQIGLTVDQVLKEREMFLAEKKYLSLHEDTRADMGMKTKIFDEGENVTKMLDEDQDSDNMVAELESYKSN